MTDNTELMREVNGIVTKTRELAEKFGTHSAEYKSYIEKADGKLDEFEKKNAEINEKIVAAEKQSEEFKERIKDLESLAATGAGKGLNGEEMKQESMEVMNALLKNTWTGFMRDPQNEQKAARVIGSLAKHAGQFHDVNEVKKAYEMVKTYGEKASADLLRSDIGEMGGFLCPDEWSSMLEKNMIEYGPIRSLARVKRTSSKTYKEPIRVGIPRATRPGEARSGARSNSNYAMNDWDPVRLTNTTAVTYEELSFNAYDLAGELMRDNAEAFAVQEGLEFFSGSGVEQGLGWSVDPNVPEYITSASGVADFDDFIEITGELKRGYNAMFMMNRKTLAQLRLKKDTGGRYLWNPAFGDAAGGAPATINGYRYNADFIEFDDLDAGAGKFPILFADMLRFYQIVDRTDMTIIRDEYTRKIDGIVEFTWNKWCVGKPKIHEAGIRMKIKA